MLLTKWLQMPNHDVRRMAQINKENNNLQKPIHSCYKNIKQEQEPVSILFTVQCHITVLNLMEMLGLQETVVQIAKVNEVRWYGHVLRRDDGHVLRKALEFEVKAKRKQRRPKKTWKIQVEESKSVGLEEVP